MPSIVDSSEGREGEVRLRSQSGRVILEETYTYLVKADYLTQSRAEILVDTPNLPIPNVTVGPGGYSICRNTRAVRRSEQSLYWDVAAEFSSEVDEGSGGNDPTTSPEQWIPVYETKWEPLQEVVARDLDDNPVVNSVGQPFETGLTITRKIPIWEFYQFEPATVSDETLIERHETINSGVFKGREPETLLLSVLSSVVGFYYGQRRRLTQYQLKYNKRKWTHKRLDVGTTFLDANGDEKAYKVKDIDGNLVQILGGLYGPLDDDPTKKGQPSGGYDGEGNPIADKDHVGVLEFNIFPKSNFSFLRG